MKITHTSLRSFGCLHDKSFDYSDGINLICGRNGDGKTTLHTATAALLFGLERGRGRAAATDTFKTYEPWNDRDGYGGEIEWQRDDRTVLAVRDFSRVPPQSRLYLKTEGSTRIISPEALPFPEGFTPFLYYNTLSFKQLGAATGDGLDAELKNHVINLRGTGDENVNVSAALQRLRTQRRQLEKQLDPAAEEEALALRDELAELESRDLTAEGEDWDRLKAAVSEMDGHIAVLRSRRDAANKELERKGRLLQKLKLTDRRQVELDYERASELCEQMKLYGDSYGSADSRPGLNFALSLLCVLGVFACIFFINTFYQADRYLLMLPLFLTAAALGTLFLRLNRRSDAILGHLRNREVLKSVLKTYLPDYAAGGSLREALELKGYLGKVRDIFTLLQQREAERNRLTEELLQTSARREALEGRLEAGLLAKVKRERWEYQLREAEARETALAPRLRKNAALRRELQAADLAISTLTRLSEQALDSFGEPLTRGASDIFREITGGSYDGLEVSDSLEIYALKGLRRIAPAALSAGTMEQLYFAFRIAVIRLLWPNEPMPLFFDDSFALYDDERLNAMLRWLAANYRGQVFLFTCHGREEQVLDRLNIPYRKFEL